MNNVLSFSLPKQSLYLENKDALVIQITSKKSIQITTQRKHYLLTPKRIRIYIQIHHTNTNNTKYKQLGHKIENKIYMGKEKKIG